MKAKLYAHEKYDENRWGMEYVGKIYISDQNMIGMRALAKVQGIELMWEDDCDDDNERTGAKMDGRPIDGGWYDARRRGSRPATGGSRPAPAEDSGPTGPSEVSKEEQDPVLF